MKIFTGLLLKALFPMSVILGILWLQGASITAWAIMYLIICLRFIHIYLKKYLMTTTGKDGGFQKIVKQSLSIVVASYSVLIIVITYIFYPFLNQRCQNGDMIVLPFLDIHSLYQLLLKEILDLIKYSCIYLMENICRMKKFIFAALYLCFHGAVIFYTIDTLGHIAAEKISWYPYQQYLSADRNEQLRNISMAHEGPQIIYPTGKIDENISSSVKYYLENHQETLRVATIPLKSLKVFVPKSNKYLPIPLAQNKYIRFTGEDVEFECPDHKVQFQIINGVALKRRYYWTFNNKLLKKKLYNHILIERMNNYFGIDSSNLMILGIGKQNFGRYACVQELVIQVNGTDKILNVFKIEIQTYILEEMEHFRMSVKASVGNMFLISGMNINILDDSSVTGYYSVNKVPVDQVCSLDKPTCSLSFTISTLLKALWYGDFEHAGYILRAEMLKHDKGFFQCKKYEYFWNGKVYECSFKNKYCLCGSAYGWHKVHFIRELYDSTQNKSKLIEITHPIQKLVLPKPRHSWFPFIDNTELYREIEEEALTSNKSEIGKKDLKFIQSSEVFLAKMDQVFTLAQFISIILLTVKVSQALFNAYKKYIICTGLDWIYHTQNIPLLPSPGHKTDEKKTELAEYEYDMFVSHSEDENDWIIQTLRPLLEDNLPLKVCFPERDLEQGQSMFESYEMAICSSRMILVILSHGYLTDRYKKKLQLDSIILPLIYENRLSEEKVMIVRYHPISLERPLQWNLNLQSIEWYYIKDKHETHKRIKEWVRAHSRHLAISC